MSVQAVVLNPEIRIVVVHKDNLPNRGEGKPTHCMQRKAAVLSCDMASEEGTPPGSESGACTHRGNSGTWESLLLPCHILPEQGLPADQIVPALTVRFPTAASLERGYKGKGDEQGAGERATSEATRNEQQAVLAEHSTDERGEPRPKEPMGGKARPGMTFHWKERRERLMSSQTVSAKLQWIAEQAVRDPGRVFTSLAHLIDVDFLKEAFRLTRKDASAGGGRGDGRRICQEPRREPSEPPRAARIRPLQGASGQACVAR